MLRSLLLSFTLMLRSYVNVKSLRSCYGFTLMLKSSWLWFGAHFKVVIADIKGLHSC